MSRLSKWVLLGIVMCFISLTAVYVTRCDLRARDDRLLETYEAANGEMRIRVSSFAEQGLFVPGAIFVYEVINDHGPNKGILTFRHDDPVSINRSSIVFVNDRIAYVFMGWKYGVTTDGGKSWSVWDAEHSLEGWKCCNYFLIGGVSITERGTGEMRLNDAHNNTASILVTNDYGMTWERLDH